MKKLTTMMLLSAGMLSLISCKKEVAGEGPVVTQERPITSFTAIDLRMAGDVYYKQDATRKLEIIAQQNILNMLETYVSDNKLVIKFNGASDYQYSEQIRINISGPDVNRFGLTTAGSIHCINNLELASLFLSVAGSGNISLMQVATHHIEATHTGSGTITATGGSTDTENLKTSGSGKIDLINISAKSVTAKTSGSGSIKVKAADHLDATVEGSGSIYFTGYPSVSSHIYGTGHLIHF